MDELTQQRLDISARLRHVKKFARAERVVERVVELPEMIKYLRQDVVGLGQVKGGEKKKNESQIWCA